MRVAGLLPPLDETHLAALRRRADRVYRPGDAGADDVFLATRVDEEIGIQGSVLVHLFDLTALPEDVRVVFFENDAAEHEPAWIVPFVAEAETGRALRRAVFATSGSIRVGGSSAASRKLVGGSADEAVVLIAGGDVEVRTSAIHLRGLAVVAAGDVVLRSSLEGGPVHTLRAVAGRDLEIRDPNGRYRGAVDPPCPPAVTALVPASPPEAP